MSMYEEVRMNRANSLWSALCGVLLAMGCAANGEEVLRPFDRDAGSVPSDTGAPGVDAPATGGCLAGQRQCRPGDGRVPQRCEGGVFVDEPRCGDEEVCYAGACVAIDGTPACLTARAEASYSGCEFWPVTVANYYAGEAENPFGIIVASNSGLPVDLRIEGGALSEPIEQRLEPHALELIRLPWVASLVGARGASVLETGGAYRVRTSAPVAIAQLNPITAVASNDASTLLPTHALGSSHLVLTTASQGFKPEFEASFAVAGVADGSTRVTITPSVATAMGGSGVPALGPGEAYTFELARGDVLQILARDILGDLSGTVVESDRPVALISGNLCANLPGTACDHLEEQTFPVTAWGRRYAVSNFGASGVLSYARILAARDGTVVSFDPPSVHAPVTLRAKQVFQLDVHGELVVDASDSVLVAQLVSGRDEGGEDPSLTYAVPVEQYRAHATFLSPPSFTSYANVIGPSGATPVLDGAPVTVPATPIGASGLSLWRLSVAVGAHELGMDGVTEPALGVMVYGFAFAGSYAYPAGMDQRVISAPF